MPLKKSNNGWFSLKEKLMSVSTYIYIFHFLLHSINEKSIGILKIFAFRFLKELHILECPEHYFTIFTKCLPVYDTNFAAKLVDRIARNLTFSCILIQTDAD